MNQKEKIEKFDFGGNRDYTLSQLKGWSEQIPSVMKLNENYEFLNFTADFLFFIAERIMIVFGFYWLVFQKFLLKWSWSQKKVNQKPNTKLNVLTQFSVTRIQFQQFNFSVSCNRHVYITKRSDYYDVRRTYYFIHYHYLA